MDWIEFDDCFLKLRRILRDFIGDGKSLGKSDVYSNYIDYRGDIKQIVHRIETEVNEYTEINRKIIEMIKKNGSDESLTNMRLEYGRQLRIDIKSFFIFTRIFLATLARIVRLYFGEKGKQLPPSMRQLVKNRALMKLDPKFARELKTKMSWIDDFIEYRVEFEHYLGRIPLTVMKIGVFGFGVRGSRMRGDLRTVSVESVVDYMKEFLSHLSEGIQFIYEKYDSAKTSPRH